VRTLAYALLASTIATSAYALEAPEPGKADPRCRKAEYDSGNVVSITTYVGRVGIIRFGREDVPERIEKFGAGESAGDVPISVPNPKPQENGGTPGPLHSALPFWGKSPGKTNLFVLTLMPDDVNEHSYMIEITVKPQLKNGEDDSDATYCLQYTYNEQLKQEKIKQAAASLPQRRRNSEREKAEARLAVDPFYGEQNYKYLAFGDKTIAPTQVSDNFSSTALRFPGNMAKPAIMIADSPAWCDLHRPPPDWYLKAPERKPTTEPVPMDDLMILHETAEHIRLRMGNQSETGQENGHVVDISNCGYDRIGHNPGTGTGSPSVVRQIITTAR
jgi:type IV secretion system protein VirB9